jgi:hypothetical protein
LTLDLRSGVDGTLEAFPSPVSSVVNGEAFEAGGGTVPYSSRVIAPGLAEYTEVGLIVEALGLEGKAGGMTCRISRGESARVMKLETSGEKVIRLSRVWFIGEGKSLLGEDEEAVAVDCADGE